MHTTTTATRWIAQGQRNHTPVSTGRLCTALVAMIVLCVLSLLALAELYWNDGSISRGLLETIQGTHLPRSDWKADPSVSLPIVPWNPV